MPMDRRHGRPKADAASGKGDKGGKKKRVFADPVQNTKRDPLLNKTYDLNSPQNVPQGRLTRWPV